MKVVQIGVGVAKMSVIIVLSACNDVMKLKQHPLICQIRNYETIEKYHNDDEMSVDF